MTAPPSALPRHSVTRRQARDRALRHSNRILANFLVRRGSLAGQRLPVVKTLATIGQGRHNDVQLPDEGVGTSHARLELRQGIWFLLSFGSGNAVWVDGEVAIGEVPLSPGSTILVGPVALFFEPRDRPSRAGGTGRGLGEPVGRGPFRRLVMILVVLALALLLLALEALLGAR